MFLPFLLFAGCVLAQSPLHHMFVGSTDGKSLFTLELDEVAKTLKMTKDTTTAGGSPSIVLDKTKMLLFASRPSDGTISRYSINEDLSLKHEGTTEIPRSCNTTKFTSLHLTSSPQPPHAIFGSASTGTCSTLFSVSVSSLQTLRSDEFKGDIRSLAWSPNGRSLHALDSHSTDNLVTSILNFRIAEDPSLRDLTGTDLLTNVTTANQLISHPTGNRAYLVTKASNELLDVPMLQTNRVDGSATPARHLVVPWSMIADGYETSSLAISSSNNTLWTLSQNEFRAIITAFSLDPTTGAVQGSVARATWQGAGNGMLVPASWESSDLVAVTNAPVGMVAVLGLDQGTPASAEVNEGESWLSVLNDDIKVDATMAPRIKAFGRADLGLDPIGEGVWVN